MRQIVFGPRSPLGRSRLLHHQALGVSLGVLLARKYAAHELARLTGLMPDHTPAGGISYGTGFIYSCNKVTNCHDGTLSRPAPWDSNLQQDQPLASLLFEAPRKAGNAGHLFDDAR